MIAIWALLAWGCIGQVTERGILAEVERIDMTLGRTQEALRQDEAKRGQLVASLSAQRTALAQVRARRDVVYGQFRRRLESLAHMPSASRWALLGGTGRLADYLQTTRVMRQVAAHDKTLHAELVAQTHELDGLQVALSQEESILSQLLVQTRTRRDTLLATRRARSDLLREVRAQRRMAQQLTQERRAAQESLGSIVGELQTTEGPPLLAEAGGAPGFGESAAFGSPVDRHRLAPGNLRPGFQPNRRHLPWPAPGAVRVAFGQRVELAFGTVTSHNGWDIAAKLGVPVQAVAAGQVVYAGWLRGYGQMVIIDHGDGYHSVTAHLATVNAAVGDSVAPGQRLGTVGDTGSLRGPVLYFEIREQGRPVDPRDWLRG